MGTPHDITQQQAVHELNELRQRGELLTVDDVTMQQRGDAANTAEFVCDAASAMTGPKKSAQEVPQKTQMLIQPSKPGMILPKTKPLTIDPMIHKVAWNNVILMNLLATFDSTGSGVTQAVQKPNGKRQALLLPRGEPFVLDAMMTAAGEGQSVKKVRKEPAMAADATGGAAGGGMGTQLPMLLSKAVNTILFYRLHDRSPCTSCSSQLRFSLLVIMVHAAFGLQERNYIGLFIQTKNDRHLNEWKALKPVTGMHDGAFR
ncbi:hypothetical protein JKP88DRAFT_263972 [Tribonema minus]|uniref:Uncharacterized protein n=1 Tax=Tribonema minus TaxID=303371 RepID=A0A836CC43_9STRA|nr:hypothetical protein JKP88DRAFT_263972 [Tribonema minus]